MRDDVAVLTLDRPPANALAPSLRKDLFTQLSRAIENPDVQSIVLNGAGAAFCPGVDLGEYDGPLAAPWVGDICGLIEDAPKPVVAAIHGLALGAGLELALAAHGRIAREQTKLGMPEVTLGLIPGGGATQRMPRLVGAQTALEILLSGQTVDAGNRRLATMFDGITPEAPVEAAISLARRLARAGSWTRTRDRAQGLSDPSGFRKSIAAVDEKLKDPASAEADIASCVEAALLLPFDRGLEYEASRFQDRIHSPLARGIRHSFTATRRARSMPDLATAHPAKVSKVVLVGTSPLVGELVLFCLGRGLEAVILGASSDGTETLLSRLRTVMDDAVVQGRVSAAERDVRWSRISAGTDPACLSEADLILDPGGLPFGAPPNLKPTAVWAVVNQARPAAERAAETGTRGRIVALRVYHPADSRTLMELAVPEGTSDDAVATVFRCLASNERSVIRTVEIPGMLGVNMMAAVTRAALALVAGGASPFDIDRAAQKMGLAVGPIDRMDRGDLARSLAELDNLCAARAQDGGAGLKLARAMKAALTDAQGGFQGFYDGADRHARGNVLDWLRAWREGNASVQPGLPDVAPATALHAAMVNEAARLIDARAVLRPSDIDLAMVRGFDFDSRKGGPLLQADIIGALSLLRAMKALTVLDTEIWTPHPLLEEMVKYGRTFF